MSKCDGSEGGLIGEEVRQKQNNQSHSSSKPLAACFTAPCRINLALFPAQVTHVKTAFLMFGAGWLSHFAGRRVYFQKGLIYNGLTVSRRGSAVWFPNDLLHFPALRFIL